MSFQVVIPAQETGIPMAKDFGIPRCRVGIPGQENGIPMIKHLITF